MDISFQVDQSANTALVGGSLSGNVILKASKQIRADKISLYFKGKEYTTVRHDHHFATDQHQFLRLDLEIPNERSIIVEKTVEPGTYEIPFSFQIPVTVPPSMEVKQRRGLHSESAKIGYFLRAIVGGSGIIKDYDSKCEIKVVSPPTVSPRETVVPHVEQPMVHPVGHSGSLGLKHDAGEITCGVKVLDTELVSGQEPQMILSIINDSTLAIKAIQLDLQQVVAWWAASNNPLHGPAQKPFHSASATQTLTTKTIHLNKEDAFTKPNSNTVKLRLQDPSRPQANHQQILQEISNGDTTAKHITLPPVPDLSLTTFQGQKIGVVHQISITLQTDASCLCLVQVVPVKIR